MPILRQDPITHDWVIFNPERARRPRDIGDAVARCPFCPGNEDLTPPATDIIFDSHGRWLARAMPNAFPALSAAESGGPPRPENGWRALPGYGRHEVIIETPDHAATLGTLNAEQMRVVLTMYLRRYRALAESDGRIRQVVLFRNQGRQAGTSLQHPHAQIVATPVVAPGTRWRLAEEIEVFDTTGACGMCQLLERERTAGQRVVYDSVRLMTLAPYASRVPYHLQIVPRRHTPAFVEIDDLELDELAVHLSRALGALHRRLNNPDYNMVGVTPPLDQIHRHANHWFIDILPRLTTPAGFELGSQIVINIMPPEQAAAALRAAAETTPC